MKKALTTTWILLTIAASACLAQTSDSNLLISSAGYQPGSRYQGAQGYKSSGGYKSTAGYKSSSRYNNSNTGYNNATQNSPQLSQDSAQQAETLQKWLDSNPSYANELQQITTGTDPAAQLQLWIQKHPDAVQQLKQLFPSTQQ